MDYGKTDKGRVMTIDPRTNDTETIARYLAAEAGEDWETMGGARQAHWVCCEANPYIIKFYDDLEKDDEFQQSSSTISSE